MVQSPQNIFQALGSFATLSARLRPNRVLAACAVLALLGTGVLEIASVAMLVPLLEGLTGEHDSAPSTILQRVSQSFPGLERGELLLLMAGAVLSLVALKNCVSYVAVLLTTRLRGAAAVELRGQLLDRMLHTPLNALENRTTGDLADLILVEAAKATLGLDLIIYSAQRATMALSYFTAILLLSWQLTLLTTLLGLLLAGTGLLMSRRLLRQAGKISAANSDLARHVTEMFGGLRLIRTTNSQRAEAARFAHVSREHATVEAQSTRLSTMSLGVNETVGVAGAMGVTAFASQFLLQGGALSVAELLAFGFGLLRLLPILNQLHGFQAALIGLSGSTAKLLAWLELRPHSARPYGARSLTELKDGIELDGVGFTYGSGKRALDEVRCFVPTGSLFAIVGPSGSGKSTLASLLLRLLEPTSGRITFDGVDYWEFSPEDYHRFVAHVEQEPFLFHATIEENVAYGNPGATRDKILRALRTVQLGDFVAALPQGLDTLVGERGASLSGGQRQRIAIARALVREPSLLVLDEPTSALDPATEREVVAAIEAARVGRTVFVIAHRAGTIARADYVMHLKDGRLHELEVRGESPKQRLSS